MDCCIKRIPALSFSPESFLQRSCFYKKKQDVDELYFRYTMIRVGFYFKELIPEETEGKFQHENRSNLGHTQ